jgi:hypothetical protein
MFILVEKKRGRRGVEGEKGGTSLWPPEFSHDLTNPLNFQISHFGLLNFELLSIRTLSSILVVKNTQKTKIYLFFFLNNKKKHFES